MARRLPDRRTLVRSALGPSAIAEAVIAAALDVDGPVVDAQGEAAWSEWLEVARAQRLASMTVAAARRGRVTPAPGIAGALSTEALAETAMSLASERSALGAIAQLRDLGLDPVLLKGATIADRFYPHPEDRPTRDVDLLLPEGQLSVAWSALRERGYGPPDHGMDPDWVGRYAKGRTLIGQDGTELDLHRTLTVLPFGLLVDLDALRECVVGFALGGRDLAVLSPEATFFHCCLHAALTNEPSVIAHLDVVVTSRACRDLDVVRRLSGTGPLTSVVRAAVTEAELLAPVAPAVRDLAASLPPSPVGDRLLAWHRRRHRSFVSSLVRSTPFVGGPVDRVKYGASVGVGLVRLATGRHASPLRRPSDA